ncbi:diguanylate cyclase [Ammonifex degensii KC4]|uniref:Diguanylate cyclase n=1 Tax=Ammonifex degensii (strain DSM 10501 / KC4) TaxID=429009 RepID=C9R8E3_AMMDK|nr:GGDEF domain-containing protein [Ammonifex degensii]ACX52572.1 diguanylate cyclase [Ammonifex degensii KC4]
MKNMLEEGFISGLVSFKDEAELRQEIISLIKRVAGVKEVRLHTAFSSPSTGNVLPLSFAGMEVGGIEFEPEADLSAVQKSLAPLLPSLSLLLAFLSLKEWKEICRQEEVVLQETGKALTLFLAGKMETPEVLTILAETLGWEVAAFVYRHKSGEIVFESNQPLSLSPEDLRRAFRQPDLLMDFFRRHGFAEGEVIPLEYDAGLALGYLFFLRRSPAPAFFLRRAALRENLGRLGAAALVNSYLYREVKELAERDGLTGLYNRRKFWEIFLKELERAKRYRRKLAILLLDVDNFKDYNDTFGHLAGDECLRRIGEVIGKEIRASDTAARYGGEEFVILLVETGGEGAVAVAERLRHRVEDIGKREPFPTISLGVAVFPEDAQSAEALLTCADNALYTAKRSGKNRTVWRGKIRSS